MTPRLPELPEQITGHWKGRYRNLTNEQKLTRREILNRAVTIAVVAGVPTLLMSVGRASNGLDLPQKDTDMHANSHIIHNLVPVSVAQVTMEDAFWGTQEKDPFLCKCQSHTGCAAGMAPCK